MKKIILILFALSLWVFTVYATSTLAKDRKSYILPYQWVPIWFYDSAHNEWESYKAQSRFSFVNWTSKWQNTFVKDSVTGLMWESTPSISIKSWQDSINYCNNFVNWWYTDWRLPSITELKSIVDYSKWSSTFDTNFFTLFPSAYWSSTNYSGNNSNAWFVYFSDGNDVYSNGKSNFYYSICVR